MSSEHQYDQDGVCKICRKSEFIISRDQLVCTPKECIELCQGGPGDGRAYMVDEGLLYYHYCEDGKIDHIYKRDYRETPSGAVIFRYLGTENRLNRL